MKYWNKERIRRVRKRREQGERISAARAAARMRESRTYTTGDSEKNSNLMLDALGLPLRRELLMRLQKNGAMSLSKLGEPFGTKLPWLYKQMQILEQSGLIATHKRGRVRMCVFNRGAFKELSAWLTSYAR
ncbi:MAG: helix-turn-helix domain-containing protein [Candidatus Kaiserbacteria bacterium]|nr:helix-turn-helix domain-containing protein [Candidatus Kaiserbacteria bacterium]